jgi:hypothetical protein
MSSYRRARGLLFEQPFGGGRTIVDECVRVCPFLVNRRPYQRAVSRPGDALAFDL